MGPSSSSTCSRRGEACLALRRAGRPCTDQKVRQRMSTQSTQRMVFNDNYWGPPRERLPELQRRTSTQTKASPLTYSHAVGRGEQTGQGFRYPVALVVNPRTGLMYVANRSYEYRIELKRITICTVDEQFVSQFSTGGFGDGQIFWPRGLAIAGDDRVYLSDEWLNRISIWTGDGDYLGKWGTAGSGDGEITGRQGSPSTARTTCWWWTGPITAFRSSPRTAGSWPRGAVLAAARASSTSPGA